MNYINASIIIQARSTSTRLPGKIFEKIGNKQILQHVLDTCESSARYTSKMKSKHGIVAEVAIVVPFGDEIINQYGRYVIIQGPEHNVLTRYLRAAKELKSDYIVRITSDCPFIPAYVISKMISISVENELDFFTNADPRYRTHPDGWDCEVMSMRMLEWLDENAAGDDREHVCSLLSKHVPSWANVAYSVGIVDFSGEKFSIDTKEDLDRLIKSHDRIVNILKTCGRAFRL